MAINHVPVYGALMHRLVAWGSSCCQRGRGPQASHAPAPQCMIPVPLADSSSLIVCGAGGFHGHLVLS
eukprot:768641-Hanusia_phi.AAC.6